MKTRKVTVYKKGGEGRKSPWGVRYWQGHNRPVVKFFTTKELAEIYATELREKFRQHADDVGAVVAGQRTFLCIFEDFMTSQRKRGLRPKTLTSYQQDARAAASLFGNRAYNSFTPQEIKDIIVRDADGKHAGHGKRMWMFIRRLYLHTGTQPPVISWDWPVEDESDVQFCTPEQVQQIFDTAPDNLKAAYALMFFAGVRTAEIARLGDANINRIDRLIRIPAAAAKKRRARVLDNLPQNLWDILGKHTLNTSNLAKRLMDHHQTLRAQGAPWIHNGARHSFATYHVAWKGYNGERHFNLCETADILGHKNGLDLLNTHYRGITDSVTADRYFRIGLVEKPQFVEVEEPLPVAV